VLLFHRGRFPGDNELNAIPHHGIASFKKSSPPVIVVGVILSLSSSSLNNENHPRPPT
jgi:hypothetical protein